MGIPSYFSHIVKKHRHIIKKFIQHKDNINNLYLDSNSIIYDAVHEMSKECNYAQIEDMLIKSVCDKIIYYITLLKPNHTLFIAFDGVAPVAKLDQQRRRRYMTWFQSQQTANVEKWNTCSVTPGTSFMSHLGDKIKKHFNNPKEFGLVNIIISTADDAGEGEHKIYEYIRSMPEYHKKSTTIIYGLDADLIMLTLNHMHISDKMFLFRETPQFIKSLDNTLDPNEHYLLDIPKFGESIIGDLSNVSMDLSNVSMDLLNVSMDLSNVSMDSNKTLFDYIFICFLLGNDFMPHFPALNIRTKGIEHLMQAYKHILGSKKLFLTDGNKIIWKNFRKYITYLSGLELDYIQAEYDLRDKMAKRKHFYKEGEEEDKTLNLPMQKRAVELYINPFEEGWRERYYSTLFDIKINDERCKEICINYLEGLEWTMKYYTSGCIDWRWSYKYHYAPLLSDLIKYIPYFDTLLLEPKMKNPVLPLVQLCYVLPKNSLYLLPQKINVLISKSRPDWYSTNCKFHWAFCKYFWESHMDMPHINISEMELLLK